MWKCGKSEHMSSHYHRLSHQKGNENNGRAAHMRSVFQRVCHCVIILSHGCSIHITDRYLSDMSNRTTSYEEHMERIIILQPKGSIKEKILQPQRICAWSILIKRIMHERNLKSQLYECRVSSWLCTGVVFILASSPSCVTVRSIMIK